MSKRSLLLSAALISVSLVGCAKDDTQDARANMTERQKDSLIARSPIPGAKAVNKAMITADSATARQTRIDSAQQNP
jgi:outer membrane lipoprotein SlyB